MATPNKDVSLRAHLLVAHPQLLDPNFFRSITLLVEHGEQGALGLVLNRPTTSTVSEVWDAISDSECRMDGLVYVGGPCQGMLTAIHAEEQAADLRVMPGVYFSQRPESIKRLISQGRNPAKFFLGFAGWMAGQLEAELREGSWLVMPAHQECVFSDREDLWESIVQEILGPGLLEVVPIHELPEHPSLN